MRSLRPRPLAFVNAMVVGDEAIVSSVRVTGRRVAGVGVSPERGDVVVDCEGAVIVPGLVNAHDHLELNSFARLKWRERYDNASQWIADFQPRFATEPALAANRPDTLADRLFAGGLKNLLAGVTTVCHHNPRYRAINGRFPVRVLERFGWSHSLLIDGDRVARSYRRTPPAWPWIIHAAEGTDDAAAAELMRLEARGCIGANTVLVHGVGLTPGDRRKAVDRGCALVWCPSSNRFLLGATARVREFAAADRLAVGSDSRLSADGDLLDELRAARIVGQLDPRTLVKAVTRGAAAVLRLAGAGRLAPGAPADLTIVARHHRDPFDSLVDARRADVRLVMIDGRPRVGHPAFGAVFTETGTARRPVRVDGRARLMEARLAERAGRAVVRESGLEVPS